METQKVVRAVENFIAEGSIEKALLLLLEELEHHEKDLYRKVIQLSGRFHNARQERLQGTISREQEEANRNQTTQGLLEILAQLERSRPGTVSVSPPKPTAPSQPPVHVPGEPEKAVLHMDLDTFFVSVERLRDSRLNGLPLLIGGSGERAVVASCSYEAREFGIHSAMPMRLARRLCPHAIVISGDYEAYTHYSHMVTDIIAESAPVYEKSSIDEFYVDMTGMERFFGSWKWALEMKKRIIKEAGLPISFGLSVNKMVSKVATNESKPDGQREVPKSEVQTFLAPMPVQKIPLVGSKTTRDLAFMGIQTVSALRQIPRDVLMYIYGKQGNMLWERARGIDESPVVPYSEQKSISTENTFSKDTIDIVFLKATLTRMVEQLAFKLRENRKLCACVTVKLRYSNFDTVTRQARIAYTANDEVLTRKVMALFEKLYHRRLLVRLVGVRLSHLVYGGHQIVLFEDTEQKVDLYEAVDTIKHKYGADAIRRASGMRGKGTS